jgi:hypothetical protein
MQTVVEDKMWQIERMFDIYKKCGGCLVLPGGLQRLMRLDEETAWIERAWTQQEAMVPGKVMCLFRWTHGDTEISGVAQGVISVVEKGFSGMMKLEKMLEGAYVEHISIE